MVPLRTDMIEVSFLVVLGAALVVWVPWRVALWRRGGGDRAREATVTVLFAWVLAVVDLTLFPMRIALYDWHFAANLVPLVETVKMWRGATLRTSIENVGGNLVMFASFGVLMPLLFAKSRRVIVLAGEAFAVSALIEIVQLVSRTRIFDIDDLILNTVGALVGLGLYHVGVRLFARGEHPRSLLARISVEGGRPPLLRAVLPVVLIVALTLPFAVVPVLLQTRTSGTGPGSIAADAVAATTGGRVVARAEWDGRAYLLTVAGTGADEVVTLHVYIEVLPGRYTGESEGELMTGGGDSWGWTTAPTKAGATGPAHVVIYGTNRRTGAVRLDVVTADSVQPLQWSGGEFFLATFTCDAADGGIFSFKVRFSDAKGHDVTAGFRTQ
jgi:glycopeptide antibiotics resistance protein